MLPVNGALLSPLLFVLTLEPFLRTISQSDTIPGFTIPGLVPQKISAYTDDLLLFITDPITTLPNVLRELHTYGELSIFQLNLQKSEALNASLPVSVVGTVKSSFSFKWTSSHINYLGINISGSLNKVICPKFPTIA